jgi:DnaD/phage-associated family protein
MKELNNVGLIDSIRQGLGKANKIYINKPMMSVQDRTKMSGLDMTKMSGQSRQKCPPNNTEYNNTVCNNTENDIGYTDRLTDELSDLIKFCNDNVEILTPFKCQILEGYVDDYGIEWVQKGLEKLAGLDRTKQNVKYLGGVLNGWKKDGDPKPWEDSKEVKQASKIMHDDVGEYELIDGYKVYL